jgi:outer membrane immunogenic protein
MKQLLLATTALLMAQAAYAADAVIEDIPVAVEVDGFSWTGFYIGIHGGYGWADSDLSFTGILVPPGTSVTSEADLDGFLIGAHAGAQYQFDSNLVLGVEVDADYRDGDGSGALVSTGAPIPPGVEQSVEYNWTGSARLRAGYAMDRWLPYVTGGFAFADIDTETVLTGVLPPPGVDLSDSDTTVGWTAGLGAEYAFTDNLLFRAEYRYSDFGEARVTALGVGTAELELETHDITVGISYKF